MIKNMRWYYCFIRGENFPGECLGYNEPLGFYTHRYVFAEGVADAEQLALEALRADDSFDLPPNAQKPNDAKIYFEEITALKKKPKKVTSKGGTWFKMSDADPDDVVGSSHD